jgi:hypothetical protein
VRSAPPISLPLLSRHSRYMGRSQIDQKSTAATSLKWYSHASREVRTDWSHSRADDGRSPLVTTITSACVMARVKVSVEIVDKWSASFRATSRILKMPAAGCLSILSLTSTISLDSVL